MYISSPAPQRLEESFSTLATWSHEGDRWEGILAADPGFEIVWRFEQDRLVSRPRITPASRRPGIVRSQGGPVALRMLRFRPEAVGAWVGGVASELVGTRPVELVDLGPRWRMVAESNTEPELFDALLRIAPSEEDSMVRASIARLREARPPSYRELADGVGYSYEQWRRRMERATGVSPKFLERYYRLQKASRLARLRPTMSMGEVAYRTGFASDCALAAESSALAGRTFRALVVGFTLPE